MIVLGIDPGSDHTGWAVVRMVFGSATEMRGGKRIYDSGVIVERKLLQAGTWKFGRQSCREWCAEHDGMVIDLACIQTPLSDDGATPLWRNRGQGRISPVSIAMKTPEAIWRAAWGWTGRISADARDAAQIAVHGAREWKTKQPDDAYTDVLKRICGATGGRAMRHLSYTPERMDMLCLAASPIGIQDRLRYEVGQVLERAGLVTWHAPGWTITPGGREVLATWEAQLRPMGEDKNT